MGKVITLEEISSIRQNKILVTTNGTFDILHVGHLRILQAARNMGDCLLVLINSDVSVQKNKGTGRPIIPLLERMEMLCGLGCVDYVMPFDTTDVLELLKLIQPEIHVKGGTFIQERIAAEQALVASYGGQHICLAQIGNFSTTNLIQKIRATLS